MSTDLTITNRFLGRMALASVVEIAAIVAVSVGLFFVSRRLAHLIQVVEETQLAPAATRVHGILDDLHEMTSLTRRLFTRLRRRESE